MAELVLCMHSLPGDGLLAHISWAPGGRDELVDFSEGRTGPIRDPPAIGGRVTRLLKDG